MTVYSESIVCFSLSDISVSLLKVQFLKIELVRKRLYILVFDGLPGGSVGKESAGCAGDGGSVPGSGRCTGEGNRNPRQYSRAWRVP